MKEKQALAQLKKEAAKREEKARKGHLELLADEEKARQMQQETAKLQLQVKKAMEEQQKLYPLKNPVYNYVDMWYYSGQFSVFNQFCYDHGEGDSNLGGGGNSCLSVQESSVSVNGVSECLSNVSEVNLELDQAQKDLINQENVSLEQIKVDGQVEALTEEGKGRFLVGNSCLSVQERCMSGKEEGVSSSSLSVQQTEGAFQPVLVENSVVVSELVLDSTKAQEGNGPKFVCAGENGTVIRLHPVSVLAESQRPDNSGACILPVAYVWLEKGVATLSDQGDILARAQGGPKDDLIVLPTDGVETCSKKEKIPKLVCGF
nr:uncharacterized protein LOC122174268 [Chrysemys picta bellii]